MVKTYKIISARKVEEIEKEINQLAVDGWEVGSLSLNKMALTPSLRSGIILPTLAHDFCTPIHRAQRPYPLAQSRLRLMDTDEFPLLRGKTTASLR